MMTGWWLGSTQDYTVLNVLQSNNKLTLRQKGCVFINVLTTNATHCLSSPQNLAHSDTEFVPPISFKLPVINIAAESRVKHPGKKTTQTLPTLNAYIHHDFLIVKLIPNSLFQGV